MALLTKKEFATACGRQTKWLSNYIGRNKVVVSESGLIDDGNVVNSEFLKTHADRKQTPGRSAARGNTPGTVPGRSGGKKKTAADAKAEKEKMAQASEL